MQRKRREDDDMPESSDDHAKEIRIPVKPGHEPKKSALNKTNHSSAWILALKLFSAVVFLLLTVVIFFAYYFRDDLPSIEQLEVYEPKLSTKVYSADGKVIKEFFRERRTRIPIQEIPKSITEALLATEDHRFYDHWGMDIIRFVKSAMVNTLTLSSSEGFSSLTQQLARNLYLSKEKTLSRKFKEVLTAIQIEKTYSKNEIMEMYLTHMYFGHDAYGIHAAAKIFFHKDVRELSLAESAYLVGHLQAPSFYMNNIQAANTRKNTVLYRMREVGYIGETEFSAARQEKIQTFPRRDEDVIGYAPYFAENVRRELEYLSDSLHFNVYEDGLNVFTTLDTRAQAAAEKAYEENVKERFGPLDKFGAEYLAANAQQYLPKYMRREGVSPERIERLLASPRAVDSLSRFYGTVQSGFVAVDPSNGHVLALIGGRDFKKYKLNHVTQIARQPGSTFKPFLYTAAIDNGYSPNFKLLNQDVVIITEDGKRWTPQNYDGGRGGPTTLRDALATSLNLVAIRLMQEVVPPATVITYAQKMGIQTTLQPVDALALGVFDVVPMQIVSAYGVFANKGIRVDPVFITRITDKDGNLLYQHIPKYKEVLSAETAYIMA
ncbi:MAG TPA: transglycosylase domain-containing protein, partial [bacterium]|nr:transglycosylase domain-containing protein [bacterium]